MEEIIFNYIFRESFFIIMKLKIDRVYFGAGTSGQKWILMDLLISILIFFLAPKNRFSRHFPFFLSKCPFATRLDSVGTVFSLPSRVIDNREWLCVFLQVRLDNGNWFKAWRRRWRTIWKFHLVNKPKKIFPLWVCELWMAAKAEHWMLNKSNNKTPKLRSPKPRLQLQRRPQWAYKSAQKAVGDTLIANVFLSKESRSGVNGIRLRARASSS